MGLVQVGDYKYKAFISYSHTDRKWARWLHRRLETYPIPKNIIGNVTSAGPIPKRLKPIFRDREELSASNNLGEKIEAALASSQSLIIICSPAAAKSKWVNQEILTFKRNNRDAQLFSVIVDGEPYASTMPGREEEECFPPALRYDVNADGSLSDAPAEPLAADIRPHADGKRLGFLKLLSGMVGVGLDEVVQRDMRRSRARVTAITSGSLATVLAMTTLTGFALDARSEAEQRRNDAEGLIEFMLGDLRDRLDPVGRLDVLDDVAGKAIDYYDSQGNSPRDCQSVSGNARAYYLKARIYNESNNIPLAKTHAEHALNTFTDFLSTCLHDPQFVINYAHALQWAVEPDLDMLTTHDISSEEKIDIRERALQYYLDSKSILESLSSYEDWTTEYLIEMTDVDILIGKLFRNSGNLRDAKLYFDAAENRLSELFSGINLIAEMSHLTDLNKFRLIDKYADLLSHISALAELEHNHQNALDAIQKSSQLYKKLAIRNTDEIKDWNAQFGYLGTEYSSARIYFSLNNPLKTRKILKSLREDVKVLTNMDPSNSDWKSFENDVHYSLSKLEN